MLERNGDRGTCTASGFCSDSCDRRRVSFCCIAGTKDGQKETNEEAEQVQLSISAKARLSSAFASLSGRLQTGGEGCGLVQAGGQATFLSDMGCFCEDLFLLGFLQIACCVYLQQLL